MKIYSEQLDVAVIPKELLVNQAALGLSNDEVVALLKILVIKDENNNLINFLNEQSISREVLTSLETKGIIKLRNISGRVDLEYCGLSQTKQVKVEGESNILVSKEMIDRVNFLLNRSLKSHELEKIKSWLSLEYSFNEIEEAINKSVLNDADNFNYIEKVLFNNYGSRQQSRIKIERNFELY